MINRRHFLYLGTFIITFSIFLGLFNVNNTVVHAQLTAPLLQDMPLISNNNNKDKDKEKDNSTSQIQTTASTTNSASVVTAPTIQSTSTPAATNTSTTSQTQTSTSATSTPASATTNTNASSTTAGTVASTPTPPAQQTPTAATNNPLTPVLQQLAATFAQQNTGPSGQEENVQQQPINVTQTSEPPANRPAPVLTETKAEKEKKSKELVAPIERAKVTAKNEEVLSKVNEPVVEDETQVSSVKVLTPVYKMMNYLTADPKAQYYEPLDRLDLTTTYALLAAAAISGILGLRLAFGKSTAATPQPVQVGDGIPGYTLRT